MLSNLGKYAKYAATVLLFGLLIVAFVTWGNMGDTFKPSANNVVIKAGTHQLTADQFKERIQSTLDQNNQRNPQQPMTMQDVVNLGYDKQATQAFSQQLALSELLRMVGLRPGDKMVTEEIRKIPALFDPLTGKFDAATYKKRLAENGTTPVAFEASLTDDLASRHFAAAMSAGVHAPRIYGAFSSAFTLSRRTASYFNVDPSKIPPTASPTDAQLTAFIKEFGRKNPETRVISFVRFSAKALAPSMPLDQAEVQKQFDFYKDTQSTPETRSLVEVMAKDEAQATTLAARISKGEDPQAVAKSAGVQAIVIGDKPKTSIPDAKVADAAFKLASGQTSGAIKGDLGFAVVKVTAITPGKTADIATLRPQFEMRARQQVAEQKVSDLADKYDTAHSSGADMAKAGAAAGVSMVTTEPVVVQGVTLQNKPVEGLSPKLLTEAFKLAQGSESEITSDGKGEYFVVRVDKINPAALPPLDTVRAKVEEAYRNHDIDTRLKAKADELAARIRKGETLDAVASSIGAKVEHQDLTRADAEKVGPTLGNEVMNAIFSAKKGDVASVPGPAPQDPNAPVKPLFVVVHLDNIAAADVDAAARGAQQVAGSFNQALAQDLNQAITAAAPAIVKPKINADLAKRALGVDSAPAKGKAG